VKKDEFNSRTATQYERIRAAEGVKVELEGMKEKVNGNAAAVEAVKRDTAAVVEALKKDATAAADLIKKDVAALEVLKERVGLLEVLKKDVAGLDALKEKLTASAADLKVLHADVQKLHAEVDRNKVYDLERKALRDGQHKQLEEALKEVQKGLQDCREKLARMEGAKPAADAPIPYARPADPGKAKPSDGDAGKGGEVKPAGGMADPGAAKPPGGK
jgi:chromosome segregation ATPase